MEIGEAHAQESNLLMENNNPVVHIILVSCLNQPGCSINKTLLNIDQLVEYPVKEVTIEKYVFVDHSENIICEIIFYMIVIGLNLVNDNLNIVFHRSLTFLVQESFIFVSK